MKTMCRKLKALVVFILFTVLGLAGYAQGTAFTYQGRLQDGANPANGIYDLQFALFDASSGGTQQSGAWTQLDQEVTNGLFTVTLDFGSFFPGADRWLEIGVRTNGGSLFTTLTPRQKFTATPYAITAGNLSGSITVAQLPNGVITNGASAVTLAGTFAGNGANVTNVNAAALGGLVSSNFWRTGGNAGTTASADFLGTTDNQPLEFKANGSRILRLVPDLTSPNFLAGSPANDTVGGIRGASVLGGGNASYPNRVAADYATVVGGVSNTASGNASVAMGQFNTASGYAAFASGYGTTAGGFISFAAGNSARAMHDGSFVWGDNTFADFASTANNQFLIRAAGGVGIGTTNPASALHVKSANAEVEIGLESGDPGGQRWTLQSSGTNSDVMLDRSFQIIDRTLGKRRFLIGRFGNVAIGNSSAYGPDSTAMGHSTTASGDYSTAMGYGTTASGNSSTAMGRNTIASNSFSTAMGYGTIAGGNHSTAMGRDTLASGDFSTAMGVNTTASDYSSTAMGYRTTASGYFSTVMGSDTTASGDYSTAMGDNTTAGGALSTAMGYRSRANHQGSFVWADSQDADFASTSNNQFSVRASGGVRLSDNTPGISFGSSLRQMLNLNGTLYGIGVQSSSLYFRCDSSAGTDGFIWYKGGVHSDAYANAGGGTELMHLVSSGLYVNGALVSSSDRNAKENFQPVDAQEVLAKVAALPVSRWNYRQDISQQHIGPMAQDFHAAFGVGPDDKHIATVDADGVALAAIQGLNEKVEAQRRQLEQKETQITELKQQHAQLARRMEALEQRLR